MTSTDTRPRAFSGVRVLDLTQGVAGPHATLMLALNGADVIKVEPPQGDWARQLGAVADGQSVNFVAYNRGKRSLSIDLKTEAGAQAMKKMLAACDIVVESFRPGVAARLGLGWDDARRVRSDVVYASISGFGQVGPDAHRPAVDTLIQAYSGMMRMNATPDGQPHRSGMIVVDAITGLYAYQALAAAMLRRWRFGGGEFLDISMVQAAAAFPAAKIMEFQQAGGPSGPLYVPAGMFETADGHLVLSGMRKEHYAGICRVTGHPELIDDPRWPRQEDRIAHAREINDKLQAAFLRDTCAAWLEKLHAVGVMAERVRDYGQWLREAHVVGTRACEWVDTGAFGALPVTRIPGVLPRDEPAASAGAPRLGEHSADILRELGFDEAWIAAQQTAGAVRAATRP